MGTEDGITPLPLRPCRFRPAWKLDGLSEYDVRRPLTPTGTNLLGLVKHAATTELGYLGDTFGRPSGEPLPWVAEDAEPNADMWATPDQSRADVIGLYHRAWAHADATLDALPLDAIGTVPWWPSHDDKVSLHHAVVRVISDTHRHAGHADVLRELLDGTVGMQPENPGVPPGDSSWWDAHHDRLERAARDAETTGRGAQPAQGVDGRGKAAVRRPSRPS